MTDQAKEYDIIIIGGERLRLEDSTLPERNSLLSGGTAGCVIAGRLTQAFPDLSIALLEAGPSPDEAVSRELSL